MGTRRRVGLVLGGLLVGCGPAATGLDEGAALVAQGKLEEGATKLESVCAAAPAAEACGQAERKASEARVALARQAIEKGEHLAAERQLWLALGRGDDASKAAARALLDGDELKQGLRFERAIKYLGEPAVYAEVEAVAGGSSPSAARAKAWLDQRAAARLSRAVRDACGPARRGSCSQAAEALKPGLQGPEVDEARALIEAEQRRVYPLRREAESFLQVFAADAKKQEVLASCLEKLKGGSDPSGATSAADCRKAAFGDDDALAVEGRHNGRKNNETLWRKLLKNIDDAALAEALSARKKKAQLTGEIEKIEPPKPPKKP